MARRTEGAGSSAAPAPSASGSGLDARAVSRTAQTSGDVQGQVYNGFRNSSTTTPDYQAAILKQQVGADPGLSVQQRDSAFRQIDTARDAFKRDHGAQI